MIALIQRVSRAAVCVERHTVGAIDMGLLAFIGIVREDDAATGERLLRRVLDYRVFADTAGRMNLSLRDVGGGLLLVPQFTLAADTARGNRPGFCSRPSRHRLRPCSSTCWARPAPAMTRSPPGASAPTCRCR